MGCNGVFGTATTTASFGTATTTVSFLCLGSGKTGLYTFLIFSMKALKNVYIK